MRKRFGRSVPPTPKNKITVITCTPVSLTIIVHLGGMSSSKSSLFNRRHICSGMVSNAFFIVKKIIKKASKSEIPLEKKKFFLGKKFVSFFFFRYSERAKRIFNKKKSLLGLVVEIAGLTKDCCTGSVVIRSPDRSIRPIAQLKIDSTVALGVEIVLDLRPHPMWKLIKKIYKRKKKQTPIPLLLARVPHLPHQSRRAR